MFKLTQSPNQDINEKSRCNLHDTKSHDITQFYAFAKLKLKYNANINRRESRNTALVQQDEGMKKHKLTLL